MLKNAEALSRGLPHCQQLYWWSLSIMVYVTRPYRKHPASRTLIPLAGQKHELAILP